MSAGKALLLAGTDTGVGKTMVGLLLAAALQQRGLRVVAMKPVESGCDPGPHDALALGAVTGQTDLQQLCPYHLRLPVAPQSAAEAEGRTVELAPIARTLEQLRGEADVVLVESAGGLGTPYAPELLVIDLARELELPLLLVARHVLGTVGQVLVALRLMRHEQVRCLGVVLSQTTDAVVGPEAATHAPLLRQHGGGVPLLGVLPHVGGMPQQTEALRRWAGERGAALERALDLSSLVAWIAA